MSAAVEPRTINCTQCGAPLELHGGRRVRSLNCGSCGSVLDAKDEYKVVTQFTDVHRPPMPLQLGQRGKIKGVEFTIIGVVQYRDAEGYPWLEYQMFSPTHGYHWLVFSEGHFVFSRRAREIPTMTVLQKSAFNAKGMTFKVYESYEAFVHFVEGELTYVAQVGDAISATEGICPPYSFARERSGVEEEYSFGEYLDPTDVYRTFGVTNIPRPPRSVHAIQPYIPRPWSVSLSKVARGFALAAVILALGIMVLGGGQERLNGRFTAQQVVDGAQTPEFKVSGKNSMMRLELSSGQDNSWAWYDLTVMNKDAPYAALAKEISYYHGYEGGESWSEGSDSANVYFTLEDPGRYSIQVEGSGGAGERGGNLRNSPLYFKLKEDVLVSRYFVIIAVVFFLAMLLEPLLRRRFEARRWAPVLEDDDE
ncbi:MAG: hypothetical protein ACI9BW_000682 [Gammaproteobacteria bacterium]|jgi:hypothetical protein